MSFGAVVIHRVQDLVVNGTTHQKPRIKPVKNSKFRQMEDDKDGGRISSAASRVKNEN